jgi:hypothetical protein
MATKAKLDVKWNEIDPSTLAGPVKSAYEAYKAAYTKAKEAREAFEAAASKLAALPSDKRLVVSYNFGKLSMAVADAEQPRISRKAVAFSALTAK